MADEISRREKLRALRRASLYRPGLTVGVVILSIYAAILEGIGLSFLLPIVEYAQGNNSDPSRLLELFVGAYDLLGLPFNIASLVAGVGVVITLRYLSSFTVAWLSGVLQAGYVRYLRKRSFRGALDAEIEYFDTEGSDEILNAIITQTSHSGSLITRLIKLLEVALVSVVYLAIAFYISPSLTLFAILVLGTSTYLLRSVFGSGFAVGERVAEANERVQQTVQAGTQGVRDAKLFGMTEELFADFNAAIDEYVTAKVEKQRNSSGIGDLQQLVSALAVFGLIYLGLEVASLTIASLGVFLFAMFRLSPRVSTINHLYYQLEIDLAHLVRSQEFVDELEAHTEPTGAEPAPDPITSITFENVSFSYGAGEQVLDSVSFTADRPEFVAFVGQSGAGKSTIVSLLARMYEPDSGEIRINDRPLSEFETADWRERIAVVRQAPHIFNETLRYNITLGNREIDQQEIERIADIADVDEFLEELPAGYETMLGDDGVRLSGGQKQRVALARALLKDADVLVLDEATSNLDTNIEERVQTAIESMDREYITIAIAHRLTTVQNADRIYTVADGEIVDVGTHEELLRDDTVYAELYDK
ncbi:ABC transporter ATP-binding protein [Haloarcula marina]|uniref:ABC transporter ATP-binding protein n=1 Tax=Haloarcula marina TaxID=2961574 RepID=UPI0020B7C54D|nr:ABC transporter ATP-binding protein [Halomicroarcula marina]